MEIKSYEERKQLVLQFMGEKDYKPLKFKDLCYILNVKDSDRQILLDILNELIAEYKVTKTKKDKYLLAEGKYIQGTYIGNKKGFGFVRDENGEDYFIPEKYTMNAFNEDKVVISLEPGLCEGPRKEAKIVSIISHTTTSLIGTYENSGDFGFVIADNKKVANDIFIHKKDSMGAVTGHKVIVEITGYGDSKKSPTGKVTEILGHINDPSTDLLSVVRALNIPDTFPEEVMDSLKYIPDSVEEEKIAGRRDFRMLETVTIDGEDAKDLDDAISLSYSDHIYHLGVHIADVSEYVTEGSPLDKEALLRGTSCYLIDSVIPMLPHKLSNGICSLNAHTDRLTLSCMMDIDENGTVISHEICEGIINVNERMNYTDVNAILTDKPDAPYERYKELIPMFKLMLELSKIIRAKREKRGAIDFELGETKIICDENHFPIEIKEYERNAATKLIEDFMLMANETVAEDFFWQELPFEYRTHEAPDSERVDALSVLIRNFGLYFKAGHEKIHPKEFQKVLAEVEGKPYGAMISKLTLRTMRQARYSTECLGHFGLACKYYCHFTSPIRRYPDLQIHRIIKENLRGTLDQERIKHYSRILPKISEDNSAKERRADEAEREVTKLKEIEYMSKHIGDHYEGIISGFTGMNIFVELENTVEGAINVNSLLDDYYYYDEKNYAMIGERTKKKYLLGDKIKIIVKNCDKMNKTIDFILDDDKGDN